jgi:hypothetical protein
MLLARRGEELLCAQRIAAGEDRAVGQALLERWEWALAPGAVLEGAELAAAFASWAAGSGVDGPEIVWDRAVDLTVRAGAVASDAGHAALLRNEPTQTLRQAHRHCARALRSLACEPPSNRGVWALDLE